MKNMSIIQILIFASLIIVGSQVTAQEQLEVEGAITIGDETSTSPPNGTIKYDGTDFLGRKSGIWNSLTENSPWTLIGNVIHYGTVDGSVGIGTSSPDSKLHIIHNSTGSSQLKLEESQNDKFTKLFMTNSANISDKWSMSANLGTSSDHKIGWFYNSVPSLIYDKTIEGVGINTLDPLAALHVYENNRDTVELLLAPPTNGGKQSRIIMAEDNDATFNMSWLYDGDLNLMKLYGEDDGVIHGPHFQVKRDSGNAAFGDTFASGYKLTVDGKVMCEELQVLLKADWPDYVFNDSYKLMPIVELSSFINEHHHLPGIPSATEVKEEGIAVGEMQKLMMEKIEELTLYVIDLQKEIDELKSANKVSVNEQNK